MKAHLNLNLGAGGLQPHRSYGCSIEWTGKDGSGVNAGLSDVLADTAGHVVFNLNPTLLAAIASSPGPGELKIWVRDGGTSEDAPPVADGYLLEFPVIA